MANEPRTFGTQLNVERRAFAPLQIQNRRQQDARPLKPTQGPSANINAAFLQGQENRDIFNNAQFDPKGKGSFSIYTDEGVFSQETTKPKSDDSFLDEKIVAMEKNLNSFLIDSLEKNSSEICDKENRSISCVEDSEMVALDSKENSVADDSVLDQSEVSYIQQQNDFDRLADWSRNRPGQVIVAENAGADWLPFRPFRDIKASPGATRTGVSREVIWTN